MRISDWSSDVCSSDLHLDDLLPDAAGTLRGTLRLAGPRNAPDIEADLTGSGLEYGDYAAASLVAKGRLPWHRGNGALALSAQGVNAGVRSEEHTSELQSLMRHSYAVFCLKKQTKKQ